MSSSVETFSARLCNLKSQLISERRSLRRMKIEENKFELQEQVDIQNTTWNQVVEGENPDQIIFPEEIWLQIFNHLNTRDAQNCYNTCRLFQGYLQPLSMLIKFRAVLPVLVQTGHISVGNLLTCRQVCKFWRDWVDELLENKRFWSQEVLKDTNTRLVHRSSNIKDEQLEYVNNPFFGRHVKLVCFQEPEFTMNEESYLHNPSNSAEEWFSNTTLSPTYLRNARILETVGKHIFHLDLEGDIMILLKTRFLEKLNNCSDLKSLRLKNILDPDSYFGVRPKESRKFDEYAMALPLPLLKLKTLRKLEFAGMQNSSKRFQNILCTSLVERFSGQLEEFCVRDWDSTYSEYNWKVLRKLTVKNCDSEEMLGSLGKLKANNLRTLCVRFTDSSEYQTTWLDMLLKLFQNLFQLANVELNFESNMWILSEIQVVQMSDKFSHLCSNSITSVTLVNFNPLIVTFSFLVFFPYLQKLTTDAQKECNNPSDNATSTDLLELKDSVGATDSSILYSVVWYVLPFLRSVTINIVNYREKECRTFHRKLV